MVSLKSSSQRDFSRLVAAKLHKQRHLRVSSKGALRYMVKLNILASIDKQGVALLTQCASKSMIKNSINIAKKELCKHS